MADASSGVNPSQVAALARLRRERERRAMQEWLALRRREAEALQAQETAEQHLEAEKDVRDTGEDRIYRSFPDAGPVRPTGIERHREAIRRLGARVDEAAYQLDAAAAALLEAKEAAAAGHSRLAKKSRESQKWQRIEARVQTMRLVQREAVAERESDDETELRHGRTR